MFKKLLRNFVVDFVLIGGAAFAVIFLTQGTFFWLKISIAGFLGVILWLAVKFVSKLIHELTEPYIRHVVSNISLEAPSPASKRAHFYGDARIILLISILISTLAIVGHMTTKVYSPADQNSLWIGIVGGLITGMVFFTLDCIKDLVDEDEKEQYKKRIKSLEIQLKKERKRKMKRLGKK